MNLNKIWFFLLMILSTLLIISSKSWINSWMMLEMNLMFFIPLIFIKNNILNNEFILKFFLIQIMTSSLMLMSLIIINLNYLYLFKNMINVLNLTLLMKMGLAPFYFWLNQIIEFISWYSFFLFMTWQKIAPMILLYYYMNFNKNLIIIIINCLMGAISGFNQLFIRKLLMFSSINNMGWLISTFFMNLNMWFLFFFTYSITLLNLIFWLKKSNINNLMQLFKINFKSLNMINILMLFIMLSGLPPMINFFPKWMIINYFIWNSNYWIYFMIMTSLINLFYYLRLMVPFMMNNKFNLKWNNKSNHYTINNMLNSLNMMLLLSLSFIPLIMM